MGKLFGHENSSFSLWIKSNRNESEFYTNTSISKHSIVSCT